MKKDMTHALVFAISSVLFYCGDASDGNHDTDAAPQEQPSEREAGGREPPDAGTAGMGSDSGGSSLVDSGATDTGASAVDGGGTDAGSSAVDGGDTDAGSEPPPIRTGPWRNVEIVGGGFVPGIIFSAKQEGLVYARTDIGGAYRLDRETQRWTPLLDWVGFEQWNLTGVESLATDPVEPNRLYIAAGAYTNDWTTMNGAILRSTDFGETFERTDLPFKLGGNMPGRSMGERLAIDPNQNSILYFGARSGNGLWKSTDFGVTWDQVTSLEATGNWAESYFNDPVGVVWVVLDAATGVAGEPTQTIYVGVADTEIAIYFSTDAGVTWEPLAGQPANGYLPHHGVLSADGVLYITYSDTAGPYDGSKGDVWKYDTADATWTQISPVPSSSEDNYYGYGGLAVDAQHPDTVMVTTLNSWWPDAIIFRSTDGGQSWSRIWDWADYPNRTLRYELDISGAPWLDWGSTPAPPEPSPKLGWMIGDIEVDPFDSDRMLYGTGATIYGSENLSDWDAGGVVQITVKAQGLEETAVFDLVSPPAGAQLLSGLGDLCGFRHDDVTKVPAAMMTSPTFTATTSIDFAELNPNFVVRVGNVSSDSEVMVMSIGLSHDGGANWYAAASQPNLTGGGTVSVSADGNRILWSPAGGAVHFSADGGSSWTASTGIPAEAEVASDRVNPNVFYGFANGGFYLSTDGGATFGATAASGLMNDSVDLKAMPGHEGEIWLAGGSTGDSGYGLWHSTDSGASFTRIEDIQEADVIGFGMAAPGEDYMALYTSAKIDGVRGIYRSDDAGATWVRVNDDQNQFGSTNSAITGDPRVYGRVYVGTNGRGIVYRDLAD